jgi:cell division protein FtsZ
MGLQVTEGLGAGSKPEVGKAAAEEALEEIRDHLAGAHMVFVTAGMGGGTGTGAAPVIARAAREMGILTVGVVTKPFHFEGGRRMKVAEAGIADLQKAVDTLIIIPNQNLFRVANEKTTFADAFAMADQVLYSGVACITDLMVKEGLINLDFADVRSIMNEMGKAMMGTGEATGEKRAVLAAEAAIANPLLDETSMKGARGLLISITGGNDLTLYEVDEAASRIRQEVDEEANIILGATFEPSLDGVVRVSVVATGIDQAAISQIEPVSVHLRSEPGPRQRAAAPLPVRTAPPAPTSIEAAQPGAVATDVEIQPLAAPVIAFPEPLELHRESEEDEEADFIPPAPEQPAGRARMPQIEEMPQVAQNQFRALREAQGANSSPPPEIRRRSLLEKLAAFGITRHEEEAAPQATGPGLPTPAAPRPYPAPVAPPEFARSQPRPTLARALPGALDPHGRPIHRPPVTEDDHLDIPAFLRRQPK